MNTHEWIDAKHPMRLAIISGEYAGQECTLRAGLDSKDATLYFVRLDNGMCVTVTHDDVRDV